MRRDNTRRRCRFYTRAAILPKKKMVPSGPGSVRAKRTRPVASLSSTRVPPSVTAAPATTYTWFFRGGEFCNTDAPVLALNDITAAYAGDYYCVASNAAGSTIPASDRRSILRRWPNPARTSAKRSSPRLTHNRP